MRDVLRHRGPDGEGLWIDGPVGLGHRRLAIVDVAGGHQPMSNEDGARRGSSTTARSTTTPSCAAGLEARGHRYRTRSDTETILHLYEEEGERLRRAAARHVRLRASGTGDRGRLLLARDRLGIKPLYYAVTDHELLFASEIKAHPRRVATPAALQRGGAAGVPRHPLRRRRGDVLPRRPQARCPATRSPGRSATGSATRRYWQLPEPSSIPARPASSDAAREVRGRLEEAVREPPHERRAARALPLGRHRLERRSPPSWRPW